MEHENVLARKRADSEVTIEIKCDATQALKELERVRSEAERLRAEYFTEYLKTRGWLYRFWHWIW